MQQPTNHVLIISKTFRQNDPEGNLTKHLLDLLGINKIEDTRYLYEDYELDINGNDELWILNNLDLAMIKRQAESICIELLRICQKINFYFNAEIDLDTYSSLYFKNKLAHRTGKILQKVEFSYKRNIDDMDPVISYCQYSSEKSNSERAKV
jgi:hypothetical protein